MSQALSEMKIASLGNKAYRRRLCNLKVTKYSSKRCGEQGLFVNEKQEKGGRRRRLRLQISIR